MNTILKNKSIVAISIFVIIFIVISFGVIYANNFASKGELNDDGQINYADVELLESHLIHLKELPQDKLENADMNSDGKITVTDLTLLIQKIEKTLDYEVTLTDIEQDNYYPNKNEEITIKFGGEVSYGANITKVVINGQEQEVQKNEQIENEYSFKTNTGNVGGTKQYHFTEVILDNGKRVKVDYTIEINVLREIPTIENYVAEPDINEMKMNLSFDIVDKDNSMLEATLEIINDQQTVIQTETLKTGKNNIDVQLENGKEYKARFALTYCLYGLEDEEHTRTILILRDLQIVVDYNFEISDIVTKKQGNETTTFEKNQPIELSFESSNITRFEPFTVKVNGKEYNVTKQGNQYSAVIDGITETGEKEVVIQEVTLENGKKFTLENDNKVTVNVIKAKPGVTELETQENIEENNIKVSFNLVDEDKALKDASIILLDGIGNEIARQQLTQEEIQNVGEIEKTLETQTTNKYILKIIATYNQTGIETEDIVDSVLLEKEIKAKARANIVEVTCNKQYPEKEENITLTYEIETNKTEEISKIRVNNTDCIVTKLENGKYQVTLAASETSGIQALVATKIIYSDGEIADVNKTLQVDVLKDKPTSEKFSQIDDIDNNSVTLTANIVDPDGAFISGKAILKKNSDNTEVASVDFSVEDATFTINNIELDTEYTMYAYMTYDRDTNRIDGNPQQENYADNYVVDEQFRERPIQLIADYQLEVNNVKTYNGENESKYFEKEQKVTVTFNCTNKTTALYPVKAIINGEEYELEKEGNNYKANITVDSSSGIKEIVIQKVILNNTKQLEVTQNNQTQIEILKEKPTVIDFGYTEADDNTITVTFKVNDEEETITSGNIIITDKEQKTVATKEIAKGENTIVFTKNGSEVYTAKVIANYDLDTNNLETGKNEHTNQEIYSEDIYVSLERRFEMKDITNTKVYQTSGEEVVEKLSIREADLANLANYVVKVEMKDMPSFYTTISEYKIEDEKLKLVLNNDNIIQYEGDKKRDKLVVTYGNMHDGIAEKDDLSVLINKIKENPEGTFNLTKDYDASGLGDTTSLIDLEGAFKGTINGNGHKIYNLNKPLFNTLENATIQNLVLEDVNLAGTNIRGTIANDATNTSIKNIHVKNLKMQTKANVSGGIVGLLTGGIIEECSVTNASITTSHTRIGGIAGNTAGGTIKNCYTEGEIISKQGKDGNGVSGILGNAEKSPQAIIENCITKINFTSNVGERLNGAIVGCPVGYTVVLRNNVSLATGTGFYKIHGAAIHSTSTNNYELEESTLVSNGATVEKVKKDNVTGEFFKNNAKFDENIWDLTDVSYNKIPHLKNDDPNGKPADEVPENADIYIPDYARLKTLENYDKNREIAYSNIYKLMPFYDSKYLILDGNKIALEDVLNTKIIKHILPYDNNKNLITLVTDKNYQNIASIKVIFVDDSTKDYTLTFDEYKENIATYDINELGIKYNFGEFVLKSDLSIANTLVQYVGTLDYTADLDPLTEEEDSRLYRDHYNEKVKNNVSDFVLNLLQYRQDGTVTIENNILNKKIQKELIETGKIKEILYAYNYYKRWYNIEMGGANVADLMLYNGKLFSDNMNIENLSNDVMTTGTTSGFTNRHTAYTAIFYANNIAKYTGKTDIGQFLDYIISTIAGYEDVNDWFTENYKGIIKELPARNHPDVEYRAWRQLKRRNGYLLPYITLPDNSAYIVSSPTQFLIGAQRNYIVDPTNPEQRQNLVNIIENYSKLIGNFYTTTAGFIEAERLNTYTDIQVDRRTTLNSEGKGEYNSPGTTEEPFHKNFCEAVGYWAAANGSGAYATGSNVYWVVNSALYDFGTWSHESGHNQDSKIFLKGNGRRGGGEDYADGNTSQGGGDGAQNFNLGYERGLDFLTTTNLTPERIDSTEKIEEFYKYTYEVWDLLDYIYAKAFLTLTPEEQSKVAVQVDYPDEGAEGVAQSDYYRTTRRSVKTKEDFEKMNLKTVEDLWDNKVGIYPNVTSEFISYGPAGGKYGYGSIYPTRWYQPHNPYGRPDSATLKSLAWEMLGIGGYEGGYMTYYSRLSSTDLEGIQKVTKDPTMTWKKYKMGRYELMESKLNTLKYIDTDEIYRQYVEALKLDAKNADRKVTASMNVKRTNFHYLKRVTNDFRDNPLATEVQITHIQTAEQFKELITAKPYGYYVLDNDIDVSGLTGTNAIIDGAFTGKFDGQGHKIIGNNLPLFEKLYYSYLDNLTVEGTRINTDKTQVGAIAKSVLLTDISNVIVNDAEVISNQDQIGGAFGYVQQIMLDNCHVKNTKVQGRGNIGGLIGYAKNATIKETSVNATVVGSGNSVAGFVGLLQDSDVFNSYTIGEVTGNQNVAGFVGVSNSSRIDSSFSSAKVIATSNSGGFIGQGLNSTILTNNISLGNSINAYKFDGRTVNDIIANYQNNYEFEEAIGMSTLNRAGIDFNGKIAIASLNDIVNTEFYTNTLNWNSEIWDFSNIADEGLPKLKNSDTNNVTNFMGKIDISSVEEFENISQKLDGIYVLKQDLDFSGYTGSGVVIASNFTGKIEGNGHTISNLTNNALFENFRGTVQNLNINNFNNQSTRDSIAAFAKNSSNATFKNMKFENITLKGGSNVGTVVAIDNRDSVFDRITVKNTNITATGMFVGGLVGAQYGGRVTNIYVDGQINLTHIGAGGIIGAIGSGTTVTISNTISNVSINRTGNTDNRNRTDNAGLVGFLASVTNIGSISNSIALGNMSGFREDMIPHKFIVTTEEIITTKLNKCYEYSGATGISDVSGNTSGHLDSISRQNLNVAFYRSLGFDESIWNFANISANGYPELK